MLREEGMMCTTIVSVALCCLAVPQVETAKDDSGFATADGLLVDDADREPELFSLPRDGGDVDAQPPGHPAVHGEIFAIENFVVAEDFEEAIRRPRGWPEFIEEQERKDEFPPALGRHSHPGDRGTMAFPARRV